MPSLIKKILMFTTLVAAISLVSCGEVSSSASSSEEASSSEASSEASSSSSSASSSESSSESSSQPTSYTPLAEPSIVFHYHRTDANYTDWNMYMWDMDGGTGNNYDFNGVDSYGAYGQYAISTWGNALKDLGFIVTIGHAWAAKDPDGDRSIRLADWPVNEFGEIHVYLQTGQSTIYVDGEGSIFNNVNSAMFTTMRTVSVSATNTPYSVEVYADGTLVKTGSGFSNATATVTLDADMAFSSVYTVKVYFSADVNDVRNATVSINKLYELSSFTSQYNYTGEDLGVTYTAASSTFKLWAPTSTSVLLHIFDNGTPESVSLILGNDDFTNYTMTKGTNGVWETTVTGDLNGKYFTYIVTNSSGTSEVVDPYAKAAGVNGLRGEILDFSTTNPEGWDAVSTTTVSSPTDLSIYELQIRDLTMDHTWNGTESNRGKFAGMHETGTTYTAGDTTVSTGFDHIKELGVNAVQILPMFDSDNDEVNTSFNWGYNPLNYNVVDGSFSSNPYDGAVRIREAKAMIKDYASADIRIIMDVVYNHVSGLNSSNFQKIVPGYYFRYKADGTPSSGSGCGNDTASERPMFSKFMVDSAAWWVSEYKIGGFRYDLMGLHDTVTMNAILAKIQTIDPDCVLNGEPWTMTTTTTRTVKLGTQTNLNLMPSIGAFNDNIRNGIKAWVKPTTSSSGTTLKVTNGAAGKLNSVVVDPKHSLEYVSCHDNYTLFDELTTSLTAAGTNVPLVDVQAQSMAFFAQGIPFMQAGEELMREKLNSDGTRNGNSYNASDEVNSLKWDRKITYKTYFDKYVEMVAFRKAHAMLRYSTSALVASNFTLLTAVGDYTIVASAPMIAYRLTKDATIDDPASEMLVIHNGNNAGMTINLGSAYRVGYKTDSSDSVGSEVSSITLSKNVTVVLYVVGIS
ncbi:MAG: type I pullulanase [Firmicutes bacterium]|nr:type I pullulanase [Bacillota bacterium]